MCSHKIRIFLLLRPQGKTYMCVAVTCTYLFILFYFTFWDLKVIGWLVFWLKMRMYG